KDEALTIVEGSAGGAGQALPARWRASDVPSLEVGASSASRSDTSPTPRQTLGGEDIARARMFVVIATLFALLVALVVPFPHGGDRGARRVLSIGLLAVIVSCVWYGWQLRRDEGHSVARTNLIAHVGLLASYAGVWYFGIYSPAIAIVVFGVAFHSLTQN